MDTSVVSVANHILDRSHLLALLFTRVMGFEEDSQEYWMIQDECVATALALQKLCDDMNDDYAPLLRFVCGLNDGSNAYYNRIKVQMEFYLAEYTAKEEIAHELCERMLFLYKHHFNSDWGCKCPGVPLTLDVLSEDFPVQYRLTNQGTVDVLKILVFLPLGRFRTEENQSDLEMNLELNTNAQNSKANSTESSSTSRSSVYTIEKPMAYHKFWCYFMLPLSCILSALLVLLGVGEFMMSGNGWSIADAIFNGVWFLFGIPALKGLRKFERKAFIANDRLLLLCIAVRGLLLISYLITIPSKVVSELVGVIFLLCTRVYFNKREYLYNR